MFWLSVFSISIFNLAAPLLGRKRVPNIDTEEVVQLTERSAHPVVLVDVRSAEEMAVSKIPGAISQVEFESERERYSHHTVIAYCTVGGRSLMFASRCAAQGLDAKNYRGSILAWCQSGRPLISPSGAPTTKVHTYCGLFKAPIGYQRDC